MKRGKLQSKDGKGLPYRMLKNRRKTNKSLEREQEKLTKTLPNQIKLP